MFVRVKVPMTGSSKTKRFLGWEMPADQYDDEIALTAYVWRHYRHLMTALEIRVGTYSVPIVSDSPMEKTRRVCELLEERDGHVPDAAIYNARLIDSLEFKKQTMRRLLRDCRNDVKINRCPKCERVTRSPTTERCTWCGHEWRQ
jgi:hypothetical protein